MSDPENPTTTTIERLVQEIVQLSRQVHYFSSQTETLTAQIETLEQERDLYQRERNRCQLRYIEEQQKCFQLERELIERACHDHDYLELKMDYSTGTHVMEKWMHPYKEQWTGIPKRTKVANLVAV